MNDTENKPVENPPTSEQKSKRERSSLTKTLPTDRIAFERQVEILRAYAACYESNGGKPVSNAQAGDTLKPTFSASTLGVAVPFFVDNSFISRVEGDFVPSPELVAYNQAVALNVAEAKRKIRPLIENTWFCRLLAPRLRLSPQSINDCIGILAIEAKAEKEHLPRIEPLIKFLELAGIVAISGTSVSFIPTTDQPQTSLDKKDPLTKNFDGIFTEQEQHSLFLDKEKTRKFIINSPLFLSRAEYERVCKWIEVTLIVAEKGNE
jgi:hypothetical protein